MRTKVITLLTLSLILSSLSLLQAQTRPPANRRSQTRSQPPSSDPQTVSEGDVVRVTTNLVTIPVSVRAHDGTYLFDLRKEEFRIYEDGVEQEIADFRSVEQPFYVVALIDTSSSTQANLGEIKEAVHAFNAQLRPRDSVLPVAFGGQVVPLLQKASSNRTILRNAIEKSHTDSGNNGTRLYDAIDFAYQVLTPVPSRRAIILFTDGDDTWSTATMRTTLCKAPELDAVIYPIQFGTSASAIYLKALATETGGRFYQADNIDTIKRSFAAVAEELRRQYNVGYYPKTTSSRPLARRIKVEVNRPDAEVIARKTLIVRR
jgi:Ca-activated chloride channel family protein